METRIKVRRGLLALGCALVLVLAGCGVTAGGAAGSSSATSPATATSSATAATKTANASTATGGVVTLSVGAAQYAASERIVVTIHNTGGDTLYVQQHNTSCSMILLQRLVTGVWQPVYPCINGFPHPTIGRVTPDSSFAVQLVPVVSGDAEGAGGGIAWPAGTYRASLHYVTSPTASFSQGTTVYSAMFAVG